MCKIASLSDFDYTHDATKDRDVSRIDEIKFTFNFKYLGAIGKDDITGLIQPRNSVSEKQRPNDDRHSHQDH